MTSRQQEETQPYAGVPMPEGAIVSPPMGLPLPPSPMQLRQPMITPALKSALFSVKDRQFLLGLEQDLLNFIASHTDSYLLRPMNSYYRLLTHQTAEYYGLGHTLNKEGDSIVVFKNMGAEPVLPMPLASRQPDPQFIIQQQQQLQYVMNSGVGGQQAPYGFQPPYSYGSGGQFGQPYNNRNRYQNRNNHHQKNQGQTATRQREEPSSDSSKPAGADPAASKSGSKSPDEKPQPTPQIKLMKREGPTKEQTPEPEESAEPSPETVEPKAAEDLESERATRESEYQKARERIFQSGAEDEIDEDLIEDMSNVRIGNNRGAFDLPRIPHQPYANFVPAQTSPLMGGNAVPQFYYPQGGIPGYQPMMYDMNYAAHNYNTQPVYYNQPPYTQGYRKRNYNQNHHGYNNNNRYKNNYNGYRNGSDDKGRYGKNKENINCVDGVKDEPTADGEAEKSEEKTQDVVGEDAGKDTTESTTAAEAEVQSRED